MCGLVKQVVVHARGGQSRPSTKRYVLASLEISSPADYLLMTLAENESRILRWTRCIVEEAYSSIDIEDESETPPNLEPAALGMAVLRLWARLFKRNTQWPFINCLGQSLEQYMSMI